MTPILIVTLFGASCFFLIVVVCIGIAPPEPSPGSSKVVPEPSAASVTPPAPLPLETNGDEPFLPFRASPDLRIPKMTLEIAKAPFALAEHLRFPTTCQPPTSGLASGRIVNITCLKGGSSSV